ncbi:hypothetical protein J4E81_002979 [Alternaria sp. BMP 2799]|nr:hypothetical protein J4E81_002979 [Alternaria sp. BMP 2799]
MKLCTTILRLALCAATTASVHLSESQLRQNPDTIPLADLEPLTPLKQYAEQPTETWRAMFVLQAKDCERVADEFMKEHPRDVMDLPEHLKRLGC